MARRRRIKIWVFACNYKWVKGDFGQEMMDFDEISQPFPPRPRKSRGEIAPPDLSEGEALFGRKSGGMETLVPRRAGGL